MVLNVILNAIGVLTTYGVIMDFTISSVNFKSNDLIPIEFTCDGQDRSPELAWKNPPVNTKSFVMVMDDPDAPIGNWDHWLLFNIPPNVNKLEAGINKLPEGTNTGKNSWGRHDYGGPCPPDREHRYFFKLYALDITLNLEDGATKPIIESAMRGHIIASTELIGRYNRPSNQK